MEEKPVVYIFHGDDELAINQAVDKLFNQLGDPVTADMNTTRLDGATASENDLVNAVATIPFLADRRLVILTHALAHKESKNSQTQFCSMLDKLPETSALVLVIQDQQKFRDGSKVWETLTDNHWLSQWCSKNKQRAYRKGFPLPETGSMPHWIKSHAVELGGKFEEDAAHELAGLVENDTRIATQEVNKLLTYVNRERSVTVTDVRELVAFQAETSVFEMADAMGERNSAKALNLLHLMLEDQDEKEIFPMVIRQFRLLVQTRALMDEGYGVEGIQKAMKVLPFVARKLYAQARRFTLERLKASYRELLNIDIAAKSNEMSLNLGLELFITNLS